jgi:hypothetical protein
VSPLRLRRVRSGTNLVVSQLRSTLDTPVSPHLIQGSDKLY